MIRTPICEMLGIQYPIFQGGMAWVADASLASAVSNGGGLGIIAAMNSNGEQLRAEIRKCRENIPPLINSYMNISPSMRVFGTVKNPDFGEVEETGILITISDIYPVKSERHFKIMD